MKICVKDQIRNTALPLKCVTTLTGSALALEIQGMPAYMAGGEVTDLTVSVTNADGSVITGTATRDEDSGVWNILFAASNFESYGHIAYGITLVATVTTSSTSYAIKVAFGDFEVVRASASATPGDPTASYVTKGGDQYLKTQVVDEVQHYTKLAMVNHEQLGWTLTNTGDYILVGGEFVAY